MVWYWLLCFCVCVRGGVVSGTAAGSYFLAWQTTTPSPVRGHRSAPNPATKARENQRKTWDTAPPLCCLTVDVARPRGQVLLDRAQVARKHGGLAEHGLVAGVAGRAEVAVEPQLLTGLLCCVFFFGLVERGGAGGEKRGQEGGGRQRETSWPLYMAQARGGGIFYRTPP